MTVADRQPLVSHETIIHKFERIEGVDRERESVCRDEIQSSNHRNHRSISRVFRSLQISLFQHERQSYETVRYYYYSNYSNHTSLL
jgi:hypothetical protein